MRRLLLTAALGALLLPAQAHAQTAAPYYLELNDGLRYKGLVAVAGPGTSRTFGVFVVRGTAPVASRSTRRGRIRLFFDPMPGDTILVSSGPALVAQYVWDGSPAVTKACAGARALAGTAGAMAVERAGTFTFAPGRYSPRAEQSGRLARQAGGGFTATLATPVRRGALVYAVASAFVPNLFVRTAAEAPADARCVPPSGSVLPVAAASRRALLQRGLTVRVRSGQAGRALVRLYAVQPVRRGRRARRTLVATVRRTSTAAATTRLRLKVARRGRPAVRRARRLEIRATLTDVVGISRALPRRSVRLRR
jgi:hypothetical protein